MNWEDIIKIKTDDGSFLRMTDYYGFVALLKEKLRYKVQPFKGKKRGGMPRQSNININRKKGIEFGNWVIFQISGINSTSGRRYRYEFRVKEEDGDYVFMTLHGPGIHFGFNTIVNSEDELINYVAKVMGTIHEGKEIRDIELPEKEDEEDEDL